MNRMATEFRYHPIVRETGKREEGRKNIREIEEGTRTVDRGNVDGSMTGTIVIVAVEAVVVAVVVGDPHIAEHSHRIW